MTLKRGVGARRVNRQAYAGREGFPERVFLQRKGLLETPERGEGGSEHVGAGSTLLCVSGSVGTWVFRGGIGERVEVLFELMPGGS